MNKIFVIYASTDLQNKLLYQGILSVYYLEIYGNKTLHNLINQQISITCLIQMYEE